MSKYSSLAKYLSDLKETEVVLSFAEIERILGFPLPESARKLRMWWGNDQTHSQASAGWLAAGYVVEDVDFKNETVKFRKAGPLKRENVPSEQRIKVELVKGLEKQYGRILTDVRVGTKVFDFASPDGKIVGELSGVQEGSAPASYFLNIAGHLWYLETVDALEKFVIFCGDRRVPEAWLRRFGHLVKNVQVYFFDGNKIEKL